MTRIRNAFLVILAVLMSPIVANADPIVIDYSPDATGAATTECCWINTDGSQIVGDLFTLAADTTLSGASIFSGTLFGAVGDLARLRIWADTAGVPGSLLVDLVTSIDGVDGVGTATDAELHRLHATFADQSLAAGTYWFSMAGIGATFGQATGLFADGSFRYGAFDLSLECDISDQARCTDAFFQLEGRAASIPEPGTLALLAIGLFGMGVIGRRIA